MSWHFLQDQAEASWAEKSLVGAPDALLKLIPTAGQICLSDKEMESCPNTQFGTTSPPLMENLGEGLLMSSAVDSHAKESASPAKAKDWMTRVLGSGEKWQESSVRFDPVTSSWKTRGDLFVLDLPESCVIFPKWGMMRNGEFWERRTPSGLTELRRFITSATESGSSLRLMTPTCPGPHDNENTVGRDYPSQNQNSLMRQIYKLTTLTEHGNYNAKGASKTSGDGLITAIRKLPTMVSVSKTGGRNGLDGGSNARKMMTEQEVKELAGGQLNPEWAEWFQGFPIGWTDLQPLETPKFQQWLNSHGKC